MSEPVATEGNTMTEAGTDDADRRLAFLGEMGAALALLVAGLAMMVIPTLGLFTKLWSVNANSLGLYVAALVAGTGMMAFGGILAAIAGQSVRRETMMAHQASIDGTKRATDLAERMDQVTRAVDKTRVDLLAQLSALQETLKQSEAPPPHRGAHSDDAPRAASDKSAKPGSSKTT
jgi:hypothetical protein